MADELKLPIHVGIIMDGNGRWAEKRNKKRTFGHKKGADNVDRIVSYAIKKGVKVLTLYAFSSENWDRPKEEVDTLLGLIKIYFTKFIGKIVKNGVRVNVIGDKSRLPADLRKIISDSENATQNNEKGILNIAINYGGRAEIVKAVKEIVENKEEISENNISAHLYTAFCGELDLIIRTGGEIRLSNFLLFQSAYSELYFTDCLWPDFDQAEFDKALDNFTKRKRKFGKIL